MNVVLLPNLCKFILEKRENVVLHNGSRNLMKDQVMMGVSRHFAKSQLNGQLRATGHEQSETAIGDVRQVGPELKYRADIFSPAFV